MMRKTMILAALVAVMPGILSAQVDKRVEVTKAYVPSLESASKLAIAPDMTDTTRMRPEIDYTITPLSLQTTLATRPIQPAKVTYWEFNRPLPFYLKAGAGYPMNSVLDFYASTQNPGTGYVVGYVNHEGRYAKIENDLGLKRPSTRMFNRIGVAAGKYFGKRTLEGDISYDNRLYHRYPDLCVPSALLVMLPGSRVDFGDARASFRFGDDFKDLTRMNFEVAVNGGLFMSYPEIYAWYWKSGETKEQKRKVDADGRQYSFGGHAKVARGFGRHRLAAEVGYDQQRGGKFFDGIRQQQIHASLRYGYEGGVVAFEVGADYYYDRIDGDRLANFGAEPLSWNPKSKSYLIPFARVDFNLGTEGIKPFFELDGGVRDNSHRSLSLLNPYVNYNLWGDRSSVDYNGRFGVGGSLWRNRFTYRVYAGFSIRDNHLYWGSVWQGEIGTDVRFFELARQTVTSFNGEAEWRPISPLLVSLSAHGYLYNDDTKLANGAPAFDGRIGVSYQARKFTIGVSTLLQSKREWAEFVFSRSESALSAPFAADLRLNVDWRVSRSITLFAEGRNLANQKLYEFPLYREYGANFTLGIKANF